MLLGTQDSQQLRLAAHPASPQPHHAEPIEFVRIIWSQDRLATYGLPGTTAAGGAASAAAQNWPTTDAVASIDAVATAAAVGAQDWSATDPTGPAGHDHGAELLE